MNSEQAQPDEKPDPARERQERTKAALIEWSKRSRVKRRRAKR